MKKSKTDKEKTENVSKETVKDKKETITQIKNVKKRKLESHTLYSSKLKKTSILENVSGHFLYGQLQCIILGSNEGKSAKDKEKSEEKEKISFKVKSKKGIWKIKEGSFDDYQFGYIIHHEDYDAKDLFEKIHNFRSKKDEKNEVKYVNRYDWSFDTNMDVIPKEIINLKLNEDVKDAKKNKNEEKDEEKMNELCGGCLFLIDSEEYDTFIQPVLQQAIRQKVIYKNSKKKPFGVQLFNPDTEYEFGWLIFDKEKEEMIGFVYDYLNINQLDADVKENKFSTKD